MTDIATLPNGARVDLDTVPPAEQLAQRLALGCRVTFDDAPELSASYATDDNAMSAIAGALAAGARGTVGLPDSAGHGRILSVAQLVRLGAALQGYRQALALTAAARQAGNVVPWPARSVTA